MITNLSPSSKVRDSNMDENLKYLYEVGLPKYLQEDLDRVKNNSQETSTLYDCCLDELYGSINSALYGHEITEEQAIYLRDKYFFGNLMKEGD